MALFTAAQDVPYFYIVRDKQGKTVDMGYVTQLASHAMVRTAISVGCTIDLLVPNHTCH